MAKAICVIGPSYCGKDYFIRKLKIFTDAKVVNFGDELRNIKENSLCVKSDALIKILRKYASYENIIVNNAFKNVEQADTVIKFLSDASFEINVVYISNERDYDITSRKREDDDKILAKQRLWDENWPELKKFLETQKLNNVLTFNTVRNTNQGIIL